MSKVAYDHATRTTTRTTTSMMSAAQPDLDFTSFSDVSSSELGLSSHSLSRGEKNLVLRSPAGSSPLTTASSSSSPGVTNKHQHKQLRRRLHGQKKRVRFGTVSLFRHAVVLGHDDHPSGGPTLALGNVCVDHDDLCVDLYEQCRPPRKSLEKLRLHAVDRTMWLSKKGYDYAAAPHNRRERGEPQPAEATATAAIPNYYYAGSGEGKDESIVMKPLLLLEEPVRHPRALFPPAVNGSSSSSAIELQETIRNRPPSRSRGAVNVLSSTTASSQPATRTSGTPSRSRLAAVQTVSSSSSTGASRPTKRMSQPLSRSRPSRRSSATGVIPSRRAPDASSPLDVVVTTAHSSRISSCPEISLASCSNHSIAATSTARNNNNSNKMKTAFLQNKVVNMIMKKKSNNNPPLALLTRDCRRATSNPGVDQEAEFNPEAGEQEQQEPSTTNVRMRRNESYNLVEEEPEDEQEETTNPISYPNEYSREGDVELPTTNNNPPPEQAPPRNAPSAAAAAVRGFTVLDKTRGSTKKLLRAVRGGKQQASTTNQQKLFRRNSTTGDGFGNILGGASSSSSSTTTTGGGGTNKGRRTTVNDNPTNNKNRRFQSDSNIPWPSSSGSSSNLTTHTAAAGQGGGPAMCAPVVGRPRSQPRAGRRRSSTTTITATTGAAPATAGTTESSSSKKTKDTSTVSSSTTSKSKRKNRNGSNDNATDTEGDSSSVSSSSSRSSRHQARLNTTFRTMQLLIQLEKEHKERQEQRNLRTSFLYVGDRDNDDDDDSSLGDHSVSSQQQHRGLPTKNKKTQPQRTKLLDENDDRKSAARPISSSIRGNPTSVLRGRRHVQFSIISIHFYDAILGDHPCVTHGGPPLSLGHNIVDHHDLDVDLYEKCRPRPRYGERLVLKAAERRERLTKHGYTSQELHEVEQQIHKIQQQRQWTAKLSASERKKLFAPPRAGFWKIKIQ